jgi:hypothetical protein
MFDGHPDDAVNGWETRISRQETWAKAIPLLKRCKEKIRILLEQTKHEYAGGENAQWLIQDIEALEAEAKKGGI